MSVATPPTELKSAPVIVPWVLVIGERTRYYRPATIERLEVDSETAHQLRIKGRGKGQVRGRNVWQDKAYCIPSEQEWFEVLRRHDRFEEALDELGTYLLHLGSYAKNLAAAGGIKKAPNPLCPSVISCKDPETDSGNGTLNLPWFLYTTETRYKLLVHTPKMLRYNHQFDGKGYESITTQDNTFCCPDDAAWEKFQALRATAIAASNQLQDYLKQLGTYQEAKHDGRYKQNGSAHPGRVDQPDSAETVHAGGIAKAVELPTTNRTNGTALSASGIEPGASSEQRVLPNPTELKVGDRVVICGDRNISNRNKLASITEKDDRGWFNTSLGWYDEHHLRIPDADEILIGDFVELYCSESGEDLPESQRRRAEVVEVFGKSHLRVRYRGETFAGGKETVQQFRKLPGRDLLPYLTEPVKMASRGDEVVVTAPDHPCYGENFTVHAISIFGAYREDGTFFYDEELGYRVEDDYIQPVPPERNEAFTVTLESGDVVVVMADDDLYEAIVTVHAILPSFEIEIDYQGILFAYPRHSLRLYERATPESLAYLKLQHGSTTPTEPTLKQRREALLTEIEEIRQSGPVAPAGAEWKRYRKTKTIGKGDRAQTVTYPADGGYYYTVWHRDAILTNAKGKLVKSLQVGTHESDLYKDWQQRFERRRTIRQLQKVLDRKKE